MSTGCTVTVCRGCCCGSPEKHPGVDHDGLLDQLRRGAPARSRVRVSDCLGPCTRSNVVVVAPAREARHRGARAVWLGWAATDPGFVRELCAWLHAGGPGVAEPPASLELHRFRPPRRAANRAADPAD